MSKIKRFSIALLIACALMAFGLATTLGINSASASVEDYSIVFDNYNGADLTVNQYEQVNLPVATFYERGVEIGNAEVYVYDQDDNLVDPYRKGSYLFMEAGEYQVVYRPIGYADKGVDGGDKNLVLNITVNANSVVDGIFPNDESLANGIVSDFNEEFYLSDAFNDYGKASIYLSEYPTVSLEQVEGDNNALKLVKGDNIVKAGIYFGARISDTIDEFSYVSLKLKTNASEVYVAGLNDTRFYKMKDLVSISLGDFAYGVDEYQTVYVKASDIGIVGDGYEGLQIVFDGAKNSYVCIDEIGFVANRKDYKFITSITERTVGIGDSYKIDMTAYLNGIKIDNPVLEYEIPEEFADKATVTADGDAYVFNAIGSGNVALRVKYYQVAGGDLIAQKDLPIYIMSALEASNLLVNTLGTNEIVNWSNENYKYVLQKSTLTGYQADFDVDSVISVGYNARYLNGSYGAATIIFPGQKTYTDGYIKLTCIFNGNTAGRTVKVYKYGETDPSEANIVATFDVANAGQGGNSSKWYEWYIPASLLTDDNGVINGIQLINSSNWMNLGKINYIPEADYVPNYVITDNVSSLPLYADGDPCQIVSVLERDGFRLNNADYYIEVTSSDSSVVFVDGLEITPFDAGDATITVNYYTDSSKEILLASKQTEVVIDTIENILTKTLSDNEFVIWDNSLYEKLLTDSTIPGRSLVNEAPEYQSFVNVNTPHSGYFFDFVPADGNGSGRNILFPVQNTYTDGYVKVKLTAQSNKFEEWTSIYVYKYNETIADNYILKASGKDALSGLGSIQIYVPVEMLTDSNNMLKGIQIIAAGVGWLRIENIEYVAKENYTPSYSVMDNVSSLAFALNGAPQTVSVSLGYDGMVIGSAFKYNVELSSSNQGVATVSGMSITPKASGSSNITVTIKDSVGATIASKTTAIEISQAEATLAQTLGKNQLVNWNNTLYDALVSDSLAGDKRMENEDDSNPQYVGSVKVVSETTGYYNYVTLDGSVGSGRTIKFPEQNAYTSGYVKIKVARQGGICPTWASVTVYKYGETNRNNFALQAKASSGGYLYGLQEADFYIPVTDLVNSNGILEGIQIVAAGMGWFQIWNIDYVETLPKEVMIDKIVPTLSGNELVNWKSALQDSLVTDTTIAEYAGKEKSSNQIIMDPYFQYEFKSSQGVDHYSDGYVGHNIEFAKKNSYTNGYLLLTVYTQFSHYGDANYGDGFIGGIKVYKFGETNKDNVVLSKILGNGANTPKNKILVPVADLLNNGVLEGVQLVMNIADGTGIYYNFDYVTVGEYLAMSLGENQIINWNDQLYSNLVSDTTISNASMDKETYEPKIVVNGTENSYYNYVPDTTGNGSGRTILFPEQKSYTNGYVRLEISIQSGKFAYYTTLAIYKVGETDASKHVIKVSGDVGDVLEGVSTGYIYIPVADIANENGVVEGFQIVQFHGGWMQVGNIDYVTEIPA